MSRRVLVTGGGTGIGRAIAHAFADQGDWVVITGRREAVLAEAASGRSIETRVADVSDEAQVRALFEQPFEVVVANAGMGHARKVSKMRLEEWTQILAVNLTGVFLTFRAALRGMQPGGRLIAIASTASLQGGNTLGAYAASKHGVLGLVRSLAIEVAKEGITCNAICPGFVETDMAESAVQNVMHKFEVDRDKAAAMITSRNPMARMIQPDEVASAALYLASAGASSVNGHALTVSGGEI